MVTFIAIPSIIRIAKVKKLTDDPGERGSHNKRVIPKIPYKLVMRMFALKTNIKAANV